MHYKFIASSSATQEEDNIPRFGKLVKKIQELEYKKTMLTARIPKKPRSSFGTLQPVLPLIPEVLPTKEEDKSQFITLDLKIRAGDPSSQKYKKYTRKFEEGTPQQWIEVLKDLKEIWTQNSVTEATDREATIHSLLHGDSLTAFNIALEEAQVDQDNPQATLQLTTKMVDEALEAVTTSVFPHRALETQKMWMKCSMKKPYDLSTRKTAAAITRLNNSLPLFPSGDENSKFSEVEIVELLEWSLPFSWRQKFDLDGYVPTQKNKATLIAHCEAIEHNQEVASLDKKKGKNKEKNQENGNPGSKRKNSKRAKADFYCRVHGRNSTHNTVDCYTIKN